MKHSRTSAVDTPVPANRKGKVKRRWLHSKSSVPLTHLARFRQGAYRFFKTLLLYPEVERFKAGLEAALELDFEVKHQAGFAFFDRWQPLVSVLESVGVTDLHRMQQEYSEVFVAKPGGIPCHPSESIYLEQQGHTAGWIMARLEQEYATAGLGLSPDLHLTPDHAAVELEFMSFLCSQEAEAWDKDKLKDGVQTLERQAAFLDRHLARWIPKWARQVALARGRGIYSVLAETAQAFISHDQDLISTLLHRLVTMPETAHLVAVDTARKP
jgi:TorA maturation chaperone TorD